MQFTPIRYVQCDKCRTKEGPPGQPGFYYVKSGSSKAVVECSCHVDWVSKNKIFLEAHKNNIWTDTTIQKYTISSYQGTKSSKALKMVDSFLKGYGEVSTRSLCLYLHGKSCTQKTHIAHFIGLSIFKKGFKAYYTQMKALSTNLCNPYTTDETEIAKRQEFISRLDKADCLIIDDAFDKNISPVYSTGTQSPYIEGFLRDRIDSKNQGVIFVSQVAPNEIKKNGYSESLQSFIENHTSKRHTLLEFYDIYDDYDVPDIFKGIADGKD